MEGTYRPPSIASTRRPNVEGSHDELDYRWFLCRLKRYQPVRLSFCCLLRCFRSRHVSLGSYPAQVGPKACGEILSLHSSLEKDLGHGVPFFIAEVIAQNLREIPLISFGPNVERLHSGCVELPFLRTYSLGPRSCSVPPRPNPPICRSSCRTDRSFPVCRRRPDRRTEGTVVIRAA
jgi:hypothetical protein